MTDEDEKLDDTLIDDVDSDGAEAEGEADEKEKLRLDVNIETRSACQRHVTVTVSARRHRPLLRQAVQRVDDQGDVPGFRAGRAPRKLVESRFRKDIGDQVKGRC